MSARGEDGLVSRNRIGEMQKEEDKNVAEEIKSES